MNNRVLTLIAAMLITGCAPNINPSSLNYGAEPTNYREIVTNFEKKAAGDPESIIIRGGRPVGQRYVWSNFGKDIKAGWGACFEVNGKNIYGGYVGFQPRFALINGGYVAYYAYGEEAVRLCAPK